MLKIAGLILLVVFLIIQYLTRNSENSFWIRLVSGGILIVAALEVLIIGGYLLYFTTLVLALVGLFELYRALGIHNKKKGTNALEIVGYAVTVMYFLVIAVDDTISVHATSILIIGLIAMLFVYVFTYPHYQYNQIMEAYFGIIYVSVMLSYVYQTRMLENGVYLVWLIFICSWGCDTCAYCAGRLFGKHKMAPVLSPKKTMEGAVGGVAGAAAIGALYAYFTGGPVLAYIIISAVGALISMVGDLSASAIKRNAGIKDYGTLIPGHGGVLDRFDSVIFTAPIIYYLAIAMI